MSDSKPHDLQQAHAIDAEASSLIKEAIHLLAQRRPDGAAEALACVERALALRSQLPFERVPAFRDGLAACWLNRAEALMQSGDSTRIAEALRSYDEGIALLRRLPLGEDPRYARRFALAHQNRALVLMMLDPSHIHEAIVAFRSALAVLALDEAAAIPDRAYLQAAIWLNLANAQLFDSSDAGAMSVRQAAANAISIVSAIEAGDADAAEVGMKARLVTCHVLAARLSEPVDGRARADDVHDATDAVDEGLSVARQWEQLGVDRFRGLASDLFRFGARVYAAYQPQFLEEFIAETLDPAASSSAFVESLEMRAAAEEAAQILSGAAHDRPWSDPGRP